MVLDALLTLALEQAGQRQIKDVRAGLGYTCVLLEDDSCGLAYTFRNELGDSCGTLALAGRLIGRTGSELIPWAKSDNRLKAAIGLAAVNAVFNTEKPGWETGNVTAALEVGPGDVFGMVGEFGPILKEIRQKTSNIYVFEQDVSGDDTLYPSQTIPQHLPKCDVVVVTATSLINHTIDEVLSCCARARQICLVGPSTPLCPEVFRSCGVTLLAGSIVTDPRRALETVSQGGGTMALKSAIRQVLVRV